MNRKYLNDLIKWYNDSLRKPLLIYGARQVGKTTLIKDIFAKEYFTKVIYIDFTIDVEERIFIKNNVNAKSIIEYLSIKNNTVIDNDTLIIFDEVQECLPCLTSLKYFCQDYRDIPIIATGSMIRIKLKELESNGKIKYDEEIRKDRQDGNNNYMFPTGKIDQLDMYPLTFGEFLEAKNIALYNRIKKGYESKEVLDDQYHNMAMNVFYEYLSLGGMPEVVATYLDTNSFVRARKTLANLYSNYLNDMTLYQISKETILRTRNVFNNIYTQLNKENKNFKISLIEKDKKYRDYMYPIDWLTEGNIVFKSRCLKEKVTLPLIKDEESLYRIYFGDVGFFSYQSGINGDKFIFDIENNELSSIFYENYVACELKYRGVELFYWKGKSSSELEFIVNIDNTIVPIDAKKNKGQLNSLNNYRHLNKKSLAIKVSQNKYGFNIENNLLTLPYYYLGFYLDEHITK